MLTNLSLTQCVVDAANTFMPITKIKHKCCVPWWNEDNRFVHKHIIQFGVHLTLRNITNTRNVKRVTREARHTY